MITIAILNQKGGVGKTTTAVTLAHGLALANHPTLLVDLDAQGNCADALGLEKGRDLYNILIDGAGVEAIQLARMNLDAILGGKETAAAKQTLVGMEFREQILKRGLDQFADDYDYCLLDAAPGVDVLQVSALVAADYFLIPVALDHLAVIGAGDALASAMSLAQLGALDARFLGILPTMWERTTNESQDQLTNLANQFQKLVWPPIPLDVHARECTACGQTLYEYMPATRALDGVLIRDRQVGGYRQVQGRLLEEVNGG